MKKLIILSLMGMLILMMVGFVQATCNVNTTKLGTTLTGTIDVEIGCQTLDAVRNCTITLSSATTGSSVSIITYNLTAGVNITNNSYTSTLSLIDYTDYQLASGTCYNLTNPATTESVTSVTGLTVDNTLPVVTGPTPADDTRYTSHMDRKEVDFSITCSNAISADLYIDGVSHTMSESSDTCTYTKDFLSDGTHEWYVIASDGTNSTTGSTYEIKVSVPGGGSSDDGGETTPSSQTSTLLMLFVVGVIAYLIFSGKTGKSKKRR